MHFEKEYMQLIKQFCKLCLPCSSTSTTGIIIQNHITSAVQDDPEDVGELVISIPVELSLPNPV